jgi:hypothetical protein
MAREGPIEISCAAWAISGGEHHMSDEGTIDRDGLYLIGPAARLVGLSPATLRALQQQGKVQCSWTPGGQRRFSGSELIRLREESRGMPPRKSTRTSPPVAVTNEEAKAREAWFGHICGRAQRELPVDTPAEIRLRLGVQIDRALRPFGPASPPDDVEALISSLIARAKRQAEQADEDAERRERKDELIDDALAHLHQRIDRLPKRLVGAARSLKWQHTKALLRARLRDQLQKGLQGDEDEEQVRDLADACLADWVDAQGPGSRVPNTLKLLAVGATGFASGATATAALSPALRAHAAKLKALLLSRAGDLLNRFSAPPPPASPPPPPADQAAPAPPPFRPGVGVAGWPSSYPRSSRYLRRATSKSPTTPRGSVTASEGQVRDVAPTNTDAVLPESPGAPGPSSC